MKEDFVTYEIAVKLKEKGFKEECLAYYTTDIDFFYNTTLDSEVVTGFKSFNSNPNSICWKRIDAPIISQVLKWLREEKKLFVEPSLFKYGYESYVQSTIFEEDKDYTDTWRVEGFHSTYEQAALSGIEYVIDNLI